MRKGLFGLALVAILVGLSAGKSHALRTGQTVTRATQKQLDLNYELKAEKVGDIVLVSMSIPRAGKLKTLQHVALDISTNRRSPLHAPLAMTEAKGIESIRFQLGTEYLENCSIMLFLQMKGRTGEYYAVQLKDYVTERKAP